VSNDDLLMVAALAALINLFGALFNIRADRLKNEVSKNEDN
jgi:hypothetical protein